MKSAPLGLLAIAVALSAPLAFTQNPALSKPFHGPITDLGTYDLATQALLPISDSPGNGSAIVYSNTVSNGSFFQQGSGVISMDWGTLSAGGLNDITEVQIGYATTTIGPVDIGVRLHEGASGFGDPGTATGFTITGLPGSDTGDPSAFIVNVRLPNAIPLADGPIGWSYETFDEGTGPLLIGPPNGPGVVDAFDQYLSVNGAYLGSFFFGGAPFASFHIELTGSSSGPTCQTDLGGAGDGSMVLSVCGDPLETINDLAILVVDGAPASATVHFLIGLKVGSSPFAGGVLVPDRIVALVSVAADGAGHIDAQVRGGGGPATVYLQAVALDGSTPSGKALSNGLELVFGP